MVTTSDTSGTFLYLEGWAYDEIIFEQSTIGDFSVRVDPFNSTVVHITMVPEEVFIFVDGELVDWGTIKEMTLAGYSLSKLLEIKMSFSTSTSGIYRINYTYTDEESGLEYGTFKELDNE